ncbi:thiopurine S-methyltransferase [Stutzerimonas stutzeri]|uniref:thiopurine S-methyltransferase n=1 Tax=Stutzerimonas stutzeri TaxID=316 RepID=UPI0015E396FB|nr:thiopurine S-methyltransferase [Stutzerimonas stutzeri]MBA1261669.1 thiopurine S-methyltransferase [Stutzerimonas stutzeri]
MDEAFWHRRWARNEIGFHLGEVNPLLRRHWPGLHLTAGAKVLVPLCGKSLDLVWLVEQGFEVLGVELSEKAVEDFFAEQNLPARIEQRDGFRIYRSGSLEIRCGDFFALTAEDVTGCQGLYDRAALIALPAPMRQRYTEHLSVILAAGCTGLLIVLDYEQAQMDGPPFAVSDAEIEASMGDCWDISLLERASALDEKFLQRGLKRMDQNCYRLMRR